MQHLLYDECPLLRCSIMNTLIKPSFILFSVCLFPWAAQAQIAAQSQITATHTSAGQDAARGNEIMACMQANLPRRFSIENFMVSSQTTQGSRQTLSGQIYFSREDAAGNLAPTRAMIKVDQPAALRDSAYLILETDDYAKSGMFVFLPAMQRVRRVSGEMADGRLFGTDISYYDFKQFRSAFGDMQVSYLGSQQLADRAIEKLRLDPMPDINVGYSYVIASIDPKTCLPLKLQFHDQLQVIKELTVPANAMVPNGEHWVMNEFTMRDFITGGQTTFKSSGLRSDQKLPEKLFHPASFYRSH